MRANRYLGAFIIAAGAGFANIAVTAESDNFCPYELSQGPAPRPGEPITAAVILTRSCARTDREPFLPLSVSFPLQTRAICAVFGPVLRILAARDSAAR